MKLRGHLLLLTLATLLPMVLFAVVASALLARREEVAFERGARERTLAVRSLEASQRIHEIVRRLERITRLEYLDLAGADVPPALDIRRSSPEPRADDRASGGPAGGQEGV